MLGMLYAKAFNLQRMSYDSTHRRSEEPQQANTPVARIIKQANTPVARIIKDHIYMSVIWLSTL